eukprot:Stramenopile-MAST_4_protein_968
MSSMDENEKQRASRRALLQKGRSLVVAETTETMEVDGEKCARSASSDCCFPSSLKSSRQRKQDAKRRVFMEQLVEPEWLLKNPTDLFLDVSESGVASDISAFDVVPMCDDKSEAGIRSPSDALKPSPEEPGWFTCSRYFERAKTAPLPMVVKQNVHSVNSAKLWPFLVVNLTCTDDSNAVMSTREGYELLDIRSIAFEGEKKDSDSNFRFELNRLYRFVIYFETFSDRAGAAEVNDIRPFVGVYQGLGSKRRLYADIYSRIMFHVNPVDL